MPDYFGWTVLTPKRGQNSHLGHTNYGMRTACGRLLRVQETLVEPFGAVDVGCLLCQRSNKMRRAEVGAR